MNFPAGPLIGLAPYYWTNCNDKSVFKGLLHSVYGKDGPLCLISDLKAQSQQNDVRLAAVSTSLVILPVRHLTCETFGACDILLENLGCASRRCSVTIVVGSESFRHREDRRADISNEAHIARVASVSVAPRRRRSLRKI